MVCEVEIDRQCDVRCGIVWQIFSFHLSGDFGAEASLLGTKKKGQLR